MKDVGINGHQEKRVSQECVLSVRVLIGIRRGRNKMVSDFEKRMLESDRRLQKNLFGSAPKKKKRVKLTPSQRLYVWEHPKMYGRKCNICSQRITKQSDMELDHTKPYSKGGSKMNLAHKECNRMKGSKGLKHIQTKMGFKKKPKKKAPIKKKTKKGQITH